MKKYRLTDESRTFSINSSRTTVYRIEALKDFGDVAAGDLGGWVESEDNLSQESDCWIYDDVVVYENARVEDSALAYGNVTISGNARLSEGACAMDKVSIYGNAKVYGKARVFDGAEIFQNARVCDNAKILGNVMVNNEAFICEEARIYENAHIAGKACISGKATVAGNTLIFDNAIVTGIATIGGTTRLGRNAVIKDEKGFINMDFLGKNLTFYKTDTGIEIVHRHYSYNLKEFLQEIEKNHDDDLLKKYKSLTYSALLCIDSLDQLDD